MRRVRSSVNPHPNHWIILASCHTIVITQSIYLDSPPIDLVDYMTY